MRIWVVPLDAREQPYGIRLPAAKTMQISGTYKDGQ
jgi:hypothetical protein